MDRPLWTHVQPLLKPRCPKCFARGDSVEVGERSLTHYGLMEIVTVQYKCINCDKMYTRKYKLSVGAPGSGVVYLSSDIPGDVGS